MNLDKTSFATLKLAYTSGLFKISKARLLWPGAYTAPLGFSGAGAGVGIGMSAVSKLFLTLGLSKINSAILFLLLKPIPA